MNTFNRDLLQSLSEAADFVEGKTEAARVHTVETPDVRAIRRGLHMSQQRFSETYRIPLPTLRNWEQGRRAPDAPAVAYLQVIAREPKTILRLAAGVASSEQRRSHHDQSRDVEA